MVRKEDGLLGKPKCKAVVSNNKEAAWMAAHQIQLNRAADWAVDAICCCKPPSWPGRVLSSWPYRLAAWTLGQAPG